MTHGGRIVMGGLLLALLQGCRMVPAETPGKGDQMLDVPLFTLAGQKTSLFEQTRGKVAVFKFGATWCVPCTRQVPHLNEIAASYPRDVVAVLEIDLQEDPRTVQAYAAKNNATHPILLDPRGTGATLYSISNIPVTIIAGPDRTIACRGGYMTAKEMDRVIAPLVEKLEAARKR